MPTYSNQCQQCGDHFYKWQSIHDEALTQCLKCGGTLVRVIEKVNTYGVGARGAQTVEVDNREANWDRDRPAYKRLRDDGLQPPAVVGAAELEAHANDEHYVTTGGKFSIPDDRKEEVSEMLAGGAMSTWSPVDEVNKRKAEV